MPNTIYFLLAFVGFLAIQIVLTRNQTKRYQAYMTRQSASTEQLIKETQLSNAQIARQIQALERIAAALENRTS